MADLQPVPADQAKKAPARPATTPLLTAIVADYVPAAFLLWATYGIVRPAFDPSQSFEPIFWYVGGATLLTMYGRIATKDVEGDDDTDDPIADKYRFTLPFLRKGKK